MNQQVIRIGPQPGPQTAFLASSARIVIYGGAAGGGKSFGLLLDAVRWHQIPSYTAMLFRREGVQHMRPGGLWMESQKVFHLLGGRPNATSRTWTWRHEGGDAVVQFGHLEHEKDKLTHQGAQYAFIGFDELTHFEESQFFYLLTRNRSTCGVTPHVRATTNPDPDSWVRRFIDWWIGPDGLPMPERSGVVRWFARAEDDSLVWRDTPDELLAELGPEVMPISATFIPASLADNPELERTDPGYRANLMASTRAEREALLGGNWNVRRAGLAFEHGDRGLMDSAPGVPASEAIHLMGVDAGGRRNPAGIVVHAVRMTADGMIAGECVYDEHWMGEPIDLGAHVVEIAERFEPAQLAVRDDHFPMLSGFLGRKLGKHRVTQLRATDAKKAAWLETLQSLIRSGRWRITTERAALRSDLDRIRVDGGKVILPTYRVSEDIAACHCDAADAELGLMAIVGQYATTTGAEVHGGYVEGAASDALPATTDWMTEGW